MHQLVQVATNIAQSFKQHGQQAYDNGELFEGVHIQIYTIRLIFYCFVTPIQVTRC
jgi:hypothetical protein